MTTWERFQAGEEPTDVAPEVLTSWRRSRLHGVDPEHVDVPFTDADPDTRLARIAVPILSRMAELLTGDGSCLALSDERGSVLWRWVSEPSLRSTLDELSVVEGFCFDEEFIGTNGLGTALETGRIALVRGSEHFVQRFHHVTCVAAPIRHPVTRRTVGAVNVTCRAEHTNPLLTVVVETLVEEIRAALRQAASHRERLLLDAFLAARRRGVGPVAIVGEDVLITDAAAAALELDHRDLWDEVRTLPEHGTVELGTVRAEVEVLRDGSTTTGALLTVADPAAPRPRPAPSTPDPWRVAARRVAQLADREPVAVCGEPGVGKLTLLREVWPDATVLDAATIPADGLGEWVRALRAVTVGPLVLTHLELLDVPAARAIAAEAVTGPLGVTVTVPEGGAPPAPASLLLDRLGAATVTVPPLRRRPDAVAALAAEIGLTLAVDALGGLRRHPWPGNLRELRRVLREAGRHARGGIVQVTDLPPEIATARRALTPLERAEAAVIASALADHGGNKSAVAKELGISRTALYGKLRAYRLG
jgi:sigma-54 dependent transcriptional regulator, acetoin dehydrogenase operon transcriptional activator AcoR